MPVGSTLLHQPAGLEAEVSAWGSGPGLSNKANWVAVKELNLNYHKQGYIVNNSVS